MASKLALVPPPLVEFEIDQGIPIPPKGRPQRFPWSQMKVGDSFFASGDRNTIACVRWAAKSRAKTTGEQFVTRTRPGGVRCWRVK